MIFSFLTPGQLYRPPMSKLAGESAGVKLFTDTGWTKTDTGFFKGYDFGNRKGNYVNILKTDTGWKVEFDDYRTIGCSSNYVSLLSNHPLHRETDNLPVDKDFEIDDLQLKLIPHYTDKPNFNFDQNLSLDHCAHNISVTILQYLENFLEYKTNDDPVVLHYSGGLDTAVIWSVINKYKLPIEVKTDNQGKVVLSRPAEQSPNLRYFAESQFKQFPGFAYKQIPLENKKWLVTGHYGGIETLRFPQHVKSIFNHYDLDYNEELHKNSKSYLYNFLQCADHNCDKTYPAKNYDTIYQTKIWITDQIKYNMEIQTVDKYQMVFPWRQIDIPVLLLNLNMEDFKEHVFHSTVHKKIIEMNDSKILALVPTQKETEIW